ncbi:MAG: hypothetical protein PSV36_18790 [Algoriphagus sp.]|nr:hypothetical protein [Algoriphagus sp.]
MTKKEFFRTRLYFTGFATLAIGALLTWNHFNGGVPSHHVLANENLPLISNWWGGILIPALTWFLTYRIQNRIYSPGSRGTANKLKQTLYRFGSALAFGTLIAVFFSIGSDMPGNMILGLIPLALFFPIYRAECLLGFVFGMTYTFGAVLPTGVGSILLLIAAAIYLLVRPGIIFVGKKLKPGVSTLKK